MATVTASDVVTADRLRDFAVAVLQKVGMSADDAAMTAGAMVWADLRDLPMHGVSGKLPQCVRRIAKGTTAARVEWTPIGRGPATVVYDARNAWGQVTGVRLMREAIEIARTHGLGLAVARNSSSAAAMGHYASLAVDTGMVGIAITNGPALMPPPGGTTRVVGNQGFAIGAPARRHRPLLFDSALSLISTGEIHTAQERGAELPPGLMLDRSGRPTVDPAVALEGLYVPIGGHRGFGLALMWEVLTGVLSGGERIAADVGQPDAYDRTQGVSHTFIAIDPTVAMPLEDFRSRVDDLIDQVHASPPAAGVERIYVPGERGYETSERRSREGIPLTAKRADTLRALAKEVSVTW
jgi:LDH2 family malate/lactate/ureidoglycolate dehydrogenase